MREEDRQKMEAEKEAMRKKMQEDMHEQMANEFRKMQEKAEEDKRRIQEEIEESKRKAAEELEQQRRELEEQRREVQETARQVRLSQVSASMAQSVVTTGDDEGQSATEILSAIRPVGEDAWTDIGDSVSVVNAKRAGTHESITSDEVKHIAQKATEAEVKKLMEAHLRQQEELMKNYQVLQEKNALLERDLHQKNEAKSEVSALQLSPPANGTPGSPVPSPSPLSNISHMEASPTTPGSTAQ